MCSGYAGLDMAIEAVFPGARPAWFCEYDDAPSRILAHHYPDVPNHIDLTTVDWTTVEPVEIVSAGYPCQPFSGAGLRKGTADERHLWPYIREAVRVLRPRYVVLENVAGHRSLGFDRVLGDMAEDGMHVRWTSVRASDIGAPHHRERLFILATPSNTHDTTGDGEWARPESRQRSANHASNAAGIGLEAGEQPVGQPAEVTKHHGSRYSLPRPHRVGRDGRRTAPLEAGRSHASVDRRSVVDWGAYGPAVRRWERLTRPAPAPTELGTRGKPRLNAEFAEWMMGLPAGHVTGVGLPRTAQLKAIGNGICVPQAAYALRSLLALEAVTA